MEEHGRILELHIEEYRDMLDDRAKTKKGPVRNWDEVAELLEKEAGWTGGGADTLTELARYYGSWVLEHAAALAVALDIEDGECGM